MTPKKVGLVLTGGGARTAYQAGVLQAIGDVCGSAQCPFQIITGQSAGSINGSFIAGHEGDYRQTTRTLSTLWSDLTVERVFRTDRRSLVRIGLRLLKDLLFGGITHRASSNFLLDNSPLGALIRENVDFEGIRRSVMSGRISGFAVTCTNYLTGTAISFHDSNPSIKDWARSNRISLPAKISAEHILASSSIPIFFPPVKVNDSYFGDGCVRMTSPLSPAIHLGATHVVAIGIRFPRTQQAVLEFNRAPMNDIRLADIAGTMMNAVFMDAMDADLERLDRINNTVRTLSARGSEQSELREIPSLVFRPSRDLGQLAAEQFANLPQSVRYLFRGIGANPRRGWDLISYLAFDQRYTKTLVELGYRDGLSRASEIERFFK